VTWLVLTIVLGIAAIGGLIYGVGAPAGHKLQAFGLTAVATGIWLVMTVFLSIHTVGQREAGVVYNFSGTIAGDSTKAPGVVMTAPWQHIKTENVGLQKEVFDFGQGNAAVSKDQQPITATLVVNVRIEPKDVIALYKTVGPNWKTILLDGRVPQDFKETTAQFTSPEITLNRPKLRTLTLERLRGELCPKSKEEPFCIGVADVFVQNVSYSEAYTQAIEAKQVQVQEALKAEAKVAQAKAEAQQAIEKAKGEATAISLRGRALRNNPEVLRLEAIDKLAPSAQVIYCNSGDCPTILGSLTGSK
jgi:regulator of protease activity HflC (stomatin/prohibitin superfamily)